MTEENRKDPLKILFVISSDLYVRNYFRTGVIASIAKTHHVEIVCPADLQLKRELKESPFFLGTYEISRVANRRRVFFFHVLMWRFRKKSKTFLYRWQRMAGFGSLRIATSHWEMLQNFLRISASLIRRPRPLVVALLGSRLIFPVTAWQYTLKEKISPDIENFISKGSFDLVVFPSAAFESVIPDLVMGARSRGITSLSLIDNWDNLSSKTVYWHKPDHLGVWGEQAKSQAIEIHGFSHEAVHPIGTPRFDSYFLGREVQAKAIYDFPYILFVGSALPFDEITALHLLEEKLETLPAVPAGLRVVYRPHPWKQKRLVPSQFVQDDFERTILDYQISEANYENRTLEKMPTAFQPELDYYPRLLGNAVAVVGPLTTMLFEATLCLRPVIALSYSDGYHFTTNRRYLNHFDGLDDVPGFMFCDSPQDLGAHLLKATTLGKVSASHSDDVTRYYLFRDEISYTERLHNLLEEVTKFS